jgi:hypothetical protein
MSAPDSEPHLRFATEPYRAARHSTHFGLVMLLVVAGAAAVGVGVLAAWLAQWIYVVVFFPLGIGLLVGVCGLVGVRTGRIADPLLAGSIGFVGACLALVTMHYGEYDRWLDTREARQAGFREQWRKQDAGFMDYVDLRAVAGVKVPGRRGRGEINLGYTGSYIYWGAEFLLAGALSCWLMWQAAAKPFCTQCQSWTEIRSLGRTNAPALPTRDALVSGELTRLAETNFADAYGRLKIQVAVCPRCGPEAPVDVQLQEIGKDKKGNDTYTELAYVTYPGEALQVFEELVRPADGNNRDTEEQQEEVEEEG